MWSRKICARKTGRVSDESANVPGAESCWRGVRQEGSKQEAFQNSRWEPVPAAHAARGSVGRTGHRRVPRPRPAWPHPASPPPPPLRPGVPTRAPRGAPTYGGARSSPRRRAPAREDARTHGCHQPPPPSCPGPRGRRRSAAPRTVPALRPPHGPTCSPPPRAVGPGSSRQPPAAPGRDARRAAALTFTSSAQPQAAATCFALGALDFAIPGLLARGRAAFLLSLFFFPLFFFFPFAGYKTPSETTQERRDGGREMDGSGAAAGEGKAGGGWRAGGGRDSQPPLHPPPDPWSLAKITAPEDC